MTTDVKCIKCGEEKPGLAAPPFRPGTKLAPLGAEIQQKICSGCYKDWIAMSVKLVNELRLDTTDPRGQELWLKQMKIFLNLDESSDPWSRHLDKRVVVETADGRRHRQPVRRIILDLLPKHKILRGRNKPFRPVRIIAVEISCCHLRIVVPPSGGSGFLVRINCPEYKSHDANQHRQIDKSHQDCSHD